MTQVVPFVHLRMHSEFSLIDSMIRIKPLMKTLLAEQMPAIALTDQSNMCAMIKFYKAAQASGIKPICGCDVFISNEVSAESAVTRMTLLAMNSKGYLNLTELVSRSFQEGQVDGKAIIQKQWLAQKNEGLIALSGAAQGEVGQTLINRGLVVRKIFYRAGLTFLVIGFIWKYSVREGNTMRIVCTCLLSWVRLIKFQ